MTIGEKLKRERKKLGYSLDSVAKKTKIAKMFLIAIENDDLTSLPGGVYTRNFLRAYAKYLDLDEDIITAEYHEQYEVKPHFVVHQEQTKRDDSVFKRQRSRFLLAIFLLILIVAGILAAVFYIPLWPVSKFREASERPVPASAVVAESETRNVVEENTQPSQPQESNALAPLEKSNHAELNDAVNPNAETESGAGEDIPEPVDVPEETTDEPPESETERTSASSQAQKALPLESVEAIRAFIEQNDLPPTVFYGDAEQIDQVFAIEALEPVHIEVYIDGDMATRRFLQPGQVRFYAYGNLHRVVIGDIGRVMLQDGKTQFSGMGRPPQNVFIHDFAAGTFIESLQAALNQSE